LLLPDWHVLQLPLQCDTENAVKQIYTAFTKKTRFVLQHIPTTPKPIPMKSVTAVALKVYIKDMKDI